MRGAREILNTLLNVVTIGRSKFPKALKEKFLGKQIRQSLKVRVRKVGIERKKKVSERKSLLQIVKNITEIETEWREC